MRILSTCRDAVSPQPSVLRTGCEETIIDVSPTTIEFDLSCIECGYNLRGLDPAGKCPECGTDVARSYASDLLRFANPSWLARVRRGVILVYYGLTFAFIVGFISGFVAVAFGSAGRLPIQALSFFVQILFLLGIYWSTSQEPRTSLEHETTPWKPAIRILIVANTLIVCVVMVLSQYGSHNLITILQACSQLMNMLVVFGYFITIVELVQRIPDPKLAKSARSAKWGLTIANGLILFVTIIAIMQTSGGSIIGGSAGPTLADVGIVIGVIGSLIYLLYLVRALRALLRMRKALKTAIAESLAIAEAPGALGGIESGFDNAAPNPSDSH